MNVPVVPSREQARTVSSVFERLETLSIALLLVGIVAVFTVWAPSGTFLTRTNLENIALDTSQILILALGMTFLLIAAGIDLSIGSIVVFASVIGAKVMVALAGTTAQVENFQYPHLTLALLGGVSAALVVGAAWGVFNGVVSVKLRMPPFIVTLATLGIALGIAQLLTGGLNVQNVPIPLQESFGLGSFAGLVPWPVVVAVGVTAVLWILLRRTRFGLRTYAIGANAEAVRRAGVNVDRHVISLYGLMGVLCGIVGVIEVSRFGTATIAGHQQDALAAISAAVIGGTSLFGGRGRISGTIVGALIPAVLLNGFVIVGVEPFWQDVAVGSVLLVAVYLDQLRRRRSAVVQFV